MIGRILAVFHARNLEFLRDRSTLGWNIALPVLLVFGLATVFSGGGRDLYKVGIVMADEGAVAAEHPFLATRYIQFVPVQDAPAARLKVARHQLDMLLDLRSEPRYWVNPDSPKGYILEKVLLQADQALLQPQQPAIQRAEIGGEPVRYIDWLVPGILGMNMMFSCLFGIGYVVVRYRKNGFLKRLNATPLTALEFVIAHVLSRLLLIVLITAFVFAGTTHLLGIRMEGSYAGLLAVATVGAFALIAMGLVVAARLSSEELAGGLLNVITWPMMLLSGVWFSLEGTSPSIQAAARLMPLTQILDAARSIMLDGAGLVQVLPQIAVLGVISIVFLMLAALLFRWRSD